MKSILVPTDFSKQSEYALQVAATIAKEHKAELFAVHMLELNQSLMTSAEGFQLEQSFLLLKLAERRLSDFLDKPYLKGIKVTPIIKHFKVFSELNEISDKHKADLIVMGSHGIDGLKELFIGSNTEKVVRNSDIPVLVIKKEMKAFKIKTLAFASDFKKNNLQVFKRVLNFAKTLGAKMNLVYVNTPGDHFRCTADINNEISNFMTLAKTDLEVEIYNDFSVERGVLNYSSQVNADMIAIATQGRKGLYHFFMGSIGEDIANHANLPVVTFKM